MKYVVPIILVALGVLAIILGGLDDAPGAQLIGVLFIMAAVVSVVRTVRRAAS